MADCSYANCVQERRFIKRELLKWNKDMLFIVGLERVAEELMGHRRWKLFQESQPNYPFNLNSYVVDRTNEIQNITVKTEHSQLINPNEEVVKLADICNNSKVIIKENLKETNPDETEIEKTEETKQNDDKGEQQSLPFDWQPQENCYFCVDGKLLSVNEKGNLVTGSYQKHLNSDNLKSANLESDTDNSDCSDRGGLSPILRTKQKSTNNLLMNTDINVAAQMLATMNGLPTALYPSLLYRPLMQQMQLFNTSTESSASNAGNAGKPQTNSLSEYTNNEQPLDLSAKNPCPCPSPSSQGLDSSKLLARSKSKNSVLTNRRTYTDEELQSALQDIITGKLGTRRAAVHYGIPRSTLRNKVYKLAMEKKETSLMMGSGVLDNLDDDEEKDLSGGEEDFSGPRSSDDMELNNLVQGNSSASYMAKYKRTEDEESGSQIKPDVSHTKPTPTSQMDLSQFSALLPFLNLPAMQQLLFASASGIFQGKQEDQVQELIKNFLIQNELFRDQLVKPDGNSPSFPVNGKLNDIDKQLPHGLAGHQIQKSYSFQQSRKSETPETSSSVDPNEYDDSAVILKIPSFKAGLTTNKTSDNKLNTVSKSTPPITSKSPNNHNSSIPPTNNSPKNSSLIEDKHRRDSMLSIFQKAYNPNAMPSVLDVNHSDPLQRPSISGLKGLPRSDTNRFDITTALLNAGVSNANANTSAQSMANALAGGKGTRPKRGKYRNYDRDSLVEAVKAVQRGEMSVHRAGSYYGVPHSTLEYKVKERHLMRPRKREPKNPPLDERTGLSSSYNKNQDFSSGSSTSAGGVKMLDKNPSIPAAIKSLGKRNFNTPPLNGLKMPYMDPNDLTSPHIYQQHLLWSGGPGNFLPMDFARRNANSTAAGLFPGQTSNNFASQIMHQFQDKGLISGNSSNKTPENHDTVMSATNPTTLYSDNNAFLDGIIRQTLERNANSESSTLLDQLVKGPSKSTINRDEVVNTSHKRAGSPIVFSHADIKREKADSPLSQTEKSLDEDATSDIENVIKHHGNNSHRLDDKSNHSEGHNGNSSEDGKKNIDGSS